MEESAFDMRVLLRAVRFILWGRFCKLWRLHAWFLRSLPLPVSLNRFLAPLLLLSFGISLIFAACVEYEKTAGFAPEVGSAAPLGRAEGYNDSAPQMQAPGRLPDWGVLGPVRARHFTAIRRREGANGPPPTSGP